MVVQEVDSEVVTVAVEVVTVAAPEVDSVAVEVAPDSLLMRDSMPERVT